MAGIYTAADAVIAGSICSREYAIGVGGYGLRPEGGIRNDGTGTGY